MKIFSYSPKRTILHRVPPLLKLLIIAALSYLIFGAEQKVVLGITGVLLLGKIFWQIDGWKQLGIFFISIFALSALFNLDYIYLQIEQLSSPFFYTLRLCDVLMLNIFFVFSTTPYQIATSVSSIFFFHKRWQKKVFLVVFLIFSLIPIIFHKSEQLNMAQRARVFRLNPLQRVIYKLFPLLVICFEAADKLSKSLEARL